VNRTTVILTILLFSLSGCGRTIPETDFDQNAKDYISYTPGSYWVYRDSANHSIIDSVIVVSNNFTIKEEAGPDIGEPHGKVQFLTTVYHSNKDGNYTIDGEAGMFIEYGDRDEPRYGDYGYYDTIPSINYYFQEPYTESASFTYLPGPDTVQIKNTVYRNVLQFRYAYANRTTFWSKHYGVIKSRTRGLTWELDTCVVGQ